jgi:hypothetical protein
MLYRRWAHVHDGKLGQGAASARTLRIDPDNDLVISMTRRSAGKNFDKYHPRFLKAVAEGMAEARK